MTYLIDDAHHGGPMLHVLVVGVESYEGEDGFETLDGVADAAIGLAEWWASSGNRMLPPTRLGSVRLLLSTEVKRVVDTHAGGRVPDRPTRGNVQAAMEEWIGLCAAGGEGVLCWTGHGGAAGERGEQALETLFCCDSHRGHQRGIAWDLTLNAINTVSGSARICCFIDACRSEDPDPLDHPSGIEGGRSRNLARRAFVHYGTALGGTAWNYNVPLPDADFPGGPLATRALHQALDRFGGLSMSRAQGICATPEALGQATAARVARWARWIAAVEGEDIAFTPAHVPGDRYRDRLIRMPSPRAMIDVHPAHGQLIDDLVCEIDAVGGTRQAQVTAPGTHECDVDHAIYNVRLSSVSRDEDIWEGRVPAYQPLIEIQP